MRFDKILVTGADGMVGASLRKLLPNAIFYGREDCNLTKTDHVFEDIEHERPDAIIHLAAKVGGIVGQTKYPASFCTENLAMNANILGAAAAFGVAKVVSVLSTCIYPDKAKYPLTEDQLHNGPPHSSNFGYAYAKRMLDVLSRAYRTEKGCNFVTVVPNNIFGVNDSFDLENSHVIPGMIRKMFEASLLENDVVLWGDGQPLREFTYSDDIAAAILFVLESYDEPTPINIGNTEEHSIAETATSVARLVGFDGKIQWDTTKPNGQLRKPSSNAKLLSLGWNKKNYTDFHVALKEVCDWFLSTYPLIRGM